MNSKKYGVGDGQSGRERIAGLEKVTIRITD